MFWIVWALLLIGHGAFSRWLKALPRCGAVVATSSDVLLITIGLLTVDQLQGLGIADTVRIGLFFVAFGWAGRRLMGSVLSRAA